MRPPKLIVSLAAAACAFAVCNAHAQLTNNVTFSLTMTTNAPGVTNGDKTTYTTKSSSLNNASLLQEIGKALNVDTNITGTNITLTSAAKLVLVTGQGADFGVIDGTNAYPLTSIMTINSTNQGVESGTVSTNANGLPRSTRQTMLIVLNYDDTSILTNAGEGLQFSLTGLVNVSTTDSGLTTTDTYTEQQSAKFAGAGEGQKGGTNGTPFICTGTVMVTGKGELTPQPPS